MQITIKELFDSLNMSVAGAQASIGLPVDQLFMGSVVLDWSGSSSAGTLKLQCSNDDVPIKPSAPVANSGVSQFVGSDPAGNVVNWADIANKSYTVASNSGCQVIELAQMPYKWVRAVYTKSAGTGSLNATFVGKG